MDHQGSLNVRGNPLIQKRAKQLKKNPVDIQSSISKPHGNHKLKIYNRWQKRKSNPKNTLKLIIISQEKRTKEKKGRKKWFTKNNQKQLTKWQ